MGKKLVAEYELDPGVDTLSRWMLHYISQQIIAAEEADETKKPEINKDCFESILKFWIHHSVYPAHINPFRDFEPIFDALAVLNPDSDKTLSQKLAFLRKEGSGEEVEDDIDSWIRLAFSIDDASRLFIDLALNEAIKRAKNNKTLEWLDAASELPGSEGDILVIRTFIENEEMALQKDKERKIAKLQYRLDKLRMYDDLSSMLRKVIEHEIEAM